MRKLVLATRNRHKVAEIAAILAGAGAPVEPVSLAEFPQAPEVEETGSTLEENALLKARSAAEASGLPAVADDTGLFVDALGGAPGVHSARYAGPECLYEKNNARLLEELRDVPEARRTARFECAVVLAAPGQPPLVFRGVLRGRIALVPRGAGGFGYDPLFVPDGGSLTLAEMSAEAKNAISHRSLAFRALSVFLGTLRPAAKPGSTAARPPQA